MSENNKMKSAASYLLGFITGVFFLATEKNQVTLDFTPCNPPYFLGLSFY